MYHIFPYKTFSKTLLVSDIQPDFRFSLFKYWGDICRRRKNIQVVTKLGLMIT